MKKLIYLACVAAMASTYFTANAQEAIKAAPAPSAQEEAWGKYMQPGEMHALLAKSNGDWTQEVTMWMNPGDKPMVSKAKCTNTMILGGRYQESKSSGDFNGMPFEGTGITGYDNAKKVFVSTWIDNMGTGIMYMEGKWNEKTRTIEFKGRSVDPMTGKEIAVRQTFKLVDDKTEVMEMFMMNAGKEFKTLEIKATRM